MANNTPVFLSLQVIEERITERLTVQNIASSVYFSRHHYSRLFREIVGEGVMEYVTKRKHTLAGRELLETDQSVLDIALRFGYDSHEGFTRSFKAYMGVTPTEYRKYGLNAISRNTVKGKCEMTYSKNTDGIIRELNAFIAKAKETSEFSRKAKLPNGQSNPFWSLIADKTDAMTGRIKNELERITTIAEHPDEITSMFAIIKTLEDCAFNSNLIACNAGLMVSRSLPEYKDAQKPLAEKTLALASSAVLKTQKVKTLFSELASLITEDMKKTAAGKISAAVQAGKAASEKITGYNYIRREVENVVSELEKPLGSITAHLLDDCAFRMDIIALSADIDLTRNPPDHVQFAGMQPFKESIRHALEFYQSFERAEKNTAKEFNAVKFLDDVAFQCNVLLFYLRGEAEKLDHAGLLDDAQKASFGKIDHQVGAFISFALSAQDQTALAPSAEMLNAIHSDISSEAAKLAERGGAVMYIAEQLKGLSSAVSQRSE
jgi:AraC-like DNA-binding protein